MTIAFGPFTFDARTRELRRDSTPVHLSPKAFDLLQVLIERRPAVVGKTEIQELIWPGTFVEDASLSVLVADIRRALDDDAKTPAFVRTIHGRGYAFCGTTVDLDDARAVSPGGGRCWLTWREHVRTLTAGRNLIGRAPECEIWIDAPGVSRRHAAIMVERDRVSLEDLGSTNGTFVGAERLSAPRTLADGDVIGLGPETLTFRRWSDDGPPPTEPVVRKSRPGRR